MSKLLLLLTAMALSPSTQPVEPLAKLEPKLFEARCIPWIVSGTLPDQVPDTLVCNPTAVDSWDPRWQRGERT